MTLTAAAPFLRFRAPILALVACAFCVLFAAPAEAATVQISSPAANASLQANVGSGGITVSTNCTSAAGTGYPGTWSIVGWAPSAAPSPGLTKSDNSDGSGSTVVTFSKVWNYTSIQVKFDRTNNNVSTPCDNTGSSSRATVTFSAQAVYQYAANTFGTNPSGVLAYNGSTKQVYVASTDDKTVYSINAADTNPPSTTTPGTASMGTLDSPQGLAAIGTGSTPTRVFATNIFSLPGTNSVQWTNGAGQRSLSGCKYPSGINANAAESAIFVACSGSNQVFQLNTDGSLAGGVNNAALPLDDSNAAPAGISRIPLNASGVTGGNLQSLVLVGDAQNDKLYLLQTGTNGPSKATTTGANPIVGSSTTNTALFGCVPANIAAPATVQTTAPVVLYVACAGKQTILPVIINVSGGNPTMSLGSAISVGARPFGVAVSPDGTRLVSTDANNAVDNTSNGSAHSMTVNTTTGVATNKVDFTLGKVPAGVGIIPGTPPLAYVADEADGTVWVIDPPTTKAKTSKKARAHRKARKHRRHKKRHAARSASINRNIAEMRARAHTSPLVPPTTGN